MWWMMHRAKTGARGLVTAIVAAALGGVVPVKGAEGALQQARREIRSAIDNGLNAAQIGGPLVQAIPPEELVAQAVALAMGRTVNRNILAFDQGAAVAEGIGSRLRLWIAGHAGAQDADLPPGAAYHASNAGLTAGVETGFTENVRLGLMVAATDIDGDVAGPSGHFDLDGRSFLGQLYAQFLSGPWAAEASLGYGATEWDFQATVGPHQEQTFDGLIGSLGLSYRILFDEPVALTLGAKITFDGSACGDNCFVAGAREQTAPWIAEASVRWDTSLDGGTWRPFVLLTLAHDLDGGDRIKDGVEWVRLDTRSAIFGVRTGLNVTLSENANLFADIGIDRSFDVDVETVRGQAGLRLTW